MRAVHGPWVKIPSRAISVFCWKVLGNIKSILVSIKKEQGQSRYYHHPTSLVLKSTPPASGSQHRLQ